MTLERDLTLWQQTGNSTHARNIANHLVTVLDQSKYQSIEKIKDVTVGHGSGAPIKSGLLWAVIDNTKAKNEALHEENEQLKAEVERQKASFNSLAAGKVYGLLGHIEKGAADGIEEFVNTMIGALESGFVEEGPITLAEIYLFMQCHIKDNYGRDVEPLASKRGKEVAELCAIGIKEGEEA